MTINQLQERANNLRRSIRLEVGSSTMDLIEELIEVELKLEGLSNQ